MTDSGDAPPRQRDCVFCAIIGGELPATRILETEHLLAFLDHRPLFRGHTLLLPKRHLRLLSDLPAGMAAEFLTTAQRLERAIEDGLGVSGSMILVNNVVSQSVPHLHLHVIPREFKDGLRFWLGPRHPYNDENPAQAYADKIRGALRLAGYPPDLACISRRQRSTATLTISRRQRSTATLTTRPSRHREDFVTYEYFYDPGRKKSSRVENPSGYAPWLEAAVAGKLRRRASRARRASRRFPGGAGPGWSKLGKGDGGFGESKPAPWPCSAPSVT